MGDDFHIVLVDRKEVGDYGTSSALPTTLLRTGRPIALLGGRPLATVEEGGPMIFDVKEFQYAYRCGHCGDEWSQKHVEEHKEG